MKKTLVFAGRNFKEIFRDPLSSIFCLGMPVFMMAMFKFILFNVTSNIDVPKGMTLDQIYDVMVTQGTPDFRPMALTPGIAVFSFSFVMLFAAISVSKDRSSSLLTRLYTSPMRVYDYILGYSIPFFVIGFIQVIICFIMGFAFGLQCEIGNLLLSFVVLIPSCVAMTAFGLLFGTFLNDKAAPGASSIIITLAGIASGAWFDIKMNDTLDVICHILPFANMVDCARAALSGNYADIIKPLIIVIAYSIVLYILSGLVFKKKMTSDSK